MSRLLPLLLGLLAAVLIAVITLELSDPEAGSGAALPVAAPRRVAAGQPVPAIDTAGHVPQWAATILARPLFSHGRRPPAAQQVAGVAAAAPLQMPRLTGVLVSSSSRSAFFAGAAGGRATVVGEGAKIGRYTVQRIEAGQVTVGGPEGTRVLRPFVEKTRPTKPAAAPARKAQAGLPRLSQPTHPGGPTETD